MAQQKPILGQTECLDPRSTGLDLCAPTEILNTLHNGQVAAAKVVSTALQQIELAAERAAASLMAGGQLVYVGAGSSGLLAISDGLELPGTFGIPEDRIKLLLAGGAQGLLALDSAAEDNAEQARADMDAAGPSSNDCAILVSASGGTAYTLSALRQLKAKGLETVGIANNPGSPLLSEASLPICLPTPPEVIAGSTRMGAGTAQKIALNMFSTLLGVKLGHIYDGHMVNLIVDNEKLKLRAMSMIAKIAECSESAAEKFLAQADGSVKLAILLAKGASSAEVANQLLTTNAGNLRPCLDALAHEQLGLNA